MPRHRARRPTPASPRADLANAPAPPEPWGSHRERYRLYLEIDRRLAALQAERDAAQQEAPGLATGGYVRSADGAED